MTLRTRTAWLICVAVILGTRQAAAADQDTKETLSSGGQQRTFYLYVPEKAEGHPAPLIVLLHGSGRDGRSLLVPWQPIAKAEGIILAAPEALKREAWFRQDDGPHFIYELIETLKVRLDVDPRRLYLFGHSAGAIHGLTLAVLESQYFAAAAVHAGILPAEVTPYLPSAARKIPIAIWVGTNDALFPLAVVARTRDTLNKEGFGAELTAISGHTHNYYLQANPVNKQVWAFLQKHRLPDDPKYQPYTFSR